MAITFDDLRAAVAPPDSSGRFQLDPSAAEWPSVSRLFRWHLPGGVLTMSGTSLRETSDAGEQRLVVEGRLAAAVLGFDGLSTRAELWVEAGEAVAFLTLTGIPAGWRPAETFPSLAGTALDRFSASDVVITLDSRETAFLPDDFQTRLGRAELNVAELARLRRGLGLRMTLRPAANAASPAWLLAAGLELRVEGPVELAPVEQAPGESANVAARMWLRTVEAPGASQLEATIWCFRLSLGLEVISTLTPLPTSSGTRELYASPLVRLTGALAWESGGRTISLPARAELQGAHASSLTLVAEPGEAFAFAVEELTALLPEAPGLLPSGFPGLNALTLDRVRLVLGADGGLRSASVRVGLADDWTIVPSAITMRSLGMQTTASNPLSSHRSVGVGIYGAMEIVPARTTLIGEVELGDGDASFSCRMEEGDEVDLGALLTSFLPETAEFPVVACDEFRLSGSIDDGRWDVIAGFRTGPLQIGAAKIEVEGVNVGLARLPGPPVSTRAQLSFALKFGSTDTLIGAWQLPGELRLEGYFDEVRLEALARELCGRWMELPGGFPDLRLEKLAFGITAPSGGAGAYGFESSARVALGESGLVDVLFEIRRDTSQKQGSQWGYVAGFAVPQKWSPAEIWSELEEALGWFAIENPGLILASMPVTVPTANLATMAALPPSLPAGVTFFGAVPLTGRLEPVSKIFGGAQRLNLAATFAKDVKQTAFIASTSAAGGASAVGFEGFSVIVRPYATSAELRSGTTLKAGDDVLSFTLSGVLDPVGSLTAALALRGVRKGGAGERGPEDGWSDPFGVPGLTIYGLGGALSVAAEGFSIAFEGELSAGAGRAEDRLVFLLAFQVTNGMLPSAAVARLRSADGEGVDLRRLIRGFTSFDVEALAVLSAVQLTDLMAYLVIDATGFRSPVDPSFVYRGLGAHANVELFGLVAQADFDFDYETGVYARGALSRPFEIPGVVRFSAADGKSGPSLAIDTRQIALGGDLLLLNGKARLFDLAELTVEGRLRRERFYFLVEAKGVPGLNACRFEVSMVAMQAVAASATAEISLGGKVRLASNGVEIGVLRLDGVVAGAAFALDADLKKFDFGVKARFRLLSKVPEVEYEFHIEQRFSELATIVASCSAELARRGWSVFGSALSDASLLWELARAGMFDFADDIGAILQKVYRLSAEAAATLYRSVGQSAEATARLLQGTYKLAANQTAKLLNANGYAVDATAAALQSLYRLDSRGMARALRDAGCTADATAKILREQYGKNGKQVGKILDEAGYGASEIAGVLKDAFGWSAKKTAEFLDDTLGYGKKAIDSAMKGAGYSSKQVEKAFKDLWGDVKNIFK